MKYVMDLHTHTLASGHAYNTIMEMAQAASERGLEALGITDHGCAIKGTCHEIYFTNFKVVPREMYGVRLFLGAEMTIIDYDGGLDLSENTQKKLDIGIAGIHNGYYNVGTCAENTRAYIKAIENPNIDIISHPDDGRIPVNYVDVVKAAQDNNVLLELNNSSLQPGNVRYAGHSADMLKLMLEQCEKQNVSVIMNSDAHFCTAGGVFTEMEQLLAGTGFPERLIVNDSLEHVLPFLHRYR